MELCQEYNKDLERLKEILAPPTAEKEGPERYRARAVGTVVVVVLLLLVLVL